MHRIHVVNQEGKTEMVIMATTLEKLPQKDEYLSINGRTHHITRQDWVVEGIDGTAMLCPRIWIWS